MRRLCTKEDATTATAEHSIIKKTDEECKL